MLKGKFAVLSLAAAALLCLQVANVETVNSGVVDACNSSASSGAGVAIACPQSDGTGLGGAGLTISVTVLDNVSAPVVGVPAADVSLIGCNDLLALCGGSGAIAASAATDLNGLTTITGDLSAGGCDVGGVRVVVQGVVIGGGACGDPCLLVVFKSPDIDGSLKCDVVDFAIFGPGYTSPPKVYSECLDFVSPFLVVNLADFALFGSHYQHQC
jgi:hypothetical protein